MNTILLMLLSFIVGFGVGAFAVKFPSKFKSFLSSIGYGFRRLFAFIGSLIKGDKN